MKNLQQFASLSATVPDAKYSKTRERNLMRDLEEELKNKNDELDEEILQAEKALENQAEHIERVMMRIKNMNKTK